VACSNHIEAFQAIGKTWAFTCESHLLFVLNELESYCTQNWCLYHDIEIGAEFYFSEEDYLAHEDVTDSKRKIKIKVEVMNNAIPLASSSSSSSSASPAAAAALTCSPTKGRKRPRRAAAAASARSYIVPDSDDEAIVDEDAEPPEPFSGPAKKKKKFESNLQLWLKHLTILLKEEQRKVWSFEDGSFESVFYLTRVPRPVQGEEETPREVCAFGRENSIVQGGRISVSRN
jgi:hypothetical protein